MLKPKITVGKLYKENRKRLKLEPLTSDAGYYREIAESDLNRPGLALSGFVELFTYQRIQVLGNTEIRYLNSLSRKQREIALDKVFEFEIPCIVITNSNKIPAELTEIATRRYISIFSTSISTTIFIQLLSTFLQNIFAPQTTVHGTLVDVYGMGLLFTGRSGIGKSEIALDLVERGHRLVADDLVMITKKAEEILMGEGREISEHLIEIRGLGLIDVRQTYGVRAVRVHKRIETEVQLVDFDPTVAYSRLSMEEQTTNILGVKVPLVVLPINPGKNITVIAETIALNQSLRDVHGHHTTREFNRRLMGSMKRREREHLRRLKTRDFLDKDFE